MDLAIELRLIVYERIRVRIRYRKVYKSESRKENDNVIFITKGIDVQFLATCKQIYAEAAPFPLPKVEVLQIIRPEFLLQGDTLHLADDVIPKIHLWIRHLEKKGTRANLGAWAIKARHSTARPPAEPITCATSRWRVYVLQTGYGHKAHRFNTWSVDNLSCRYSTFLSNHFTFCN